MTDDKSREALIDAWKAGYMRCQQDPISVGDGYGYGVWHESAVAYAEAALRYRDEQEKQA